VKVWRKQLIFKSLRGGFPLFAGFGSPLKKVPTFSESILVYLQSSESTQKSAIRTQFSLPTTIRISFILTILR
jgi:hypothetical protein